VDFLPSLTFHSLHRFGALEVLTASMHLRIYVSDPILPPFYLFQLAMQLFLQFAIPMHFGAEAVVSEASQRVIYPVLAPVVVVEDSHPLGRCRHSFFWCNAGCCVGRSLIYRSSGGSHAQGIGVVGHVDCDVPGLYFAAIVQDFEGDVAQGYVKPELFR
jgi:hypothetical protein